MAYFNHTLGGGQIFDPNRPWGEQSPTALPAWTSEEESLQFQPHAWSPDGRSIAGAVLTESGHHRPAIYDLQSETYIDSSQAFSALISSGTEFPSWLPDSSGLIVVGRDRASGTRGIFFTDREFREVREILPSEDGTSPRVSPDGRWIYFIRATFEADVWLLTFNER